MMEWVSSVLKTLGSTSKTTKEKKSSIRQSVDFVLFLNITALNYTISSHPCSRDEPMVLLCLLIALVTSLIEASLMSHMIMSALSASTSALDRPLSLQHTATSQDANRVEETKVRPPCSLSSEEFSSPWKKNPTAAVVWLPDSAPVYSPTFIS